jgi:hypothetical protein
LGFSRGKLGLHHQTLTSNDQKNVMTHYFMMKMVDLTVKHGGENTKNDDTVKTWELTNKGRMFNGYSLYEQQGMFSR